jgi:hypothetical protein
MTGPVDSKIFVSAYKEEPDSQTRRTILIERIMQPSPGLEFLDWEFLRDMEWLCEREGAVREGGPDLHRSFVEMSSKQMQAMVKATISAFRLAFSRACTLDELEENHGKRFSRLISGLLYLVARGNIGFDDDDEPGFLRPTGPPPTHEMRQKILDRIRHDHPMYIAIAHDLIDEVNLEPSTKSDPVQ